MELVVGNPVDGRDLASSDKDEPRQAAKAGVPPKVVLSADTSTMDERSVVRIPGLGTAMRMLSPGIRNWLLYLIGLLLYCHVGIVAYAFLEPDWSYATSFYFSFTIISTVGYGCLAPSSIGSRVFTMFFTVMSIPLISALLAGVWQPIVERPFDFIYSRAKRRFPILRSDLDDPLNPPAVHIYYFRGIAPLFAYAHMFACILTALASLAVGQQPGGFANSLDGPEDGKLAPFTALYFTVITSSTVGFGDVCPITDAARVFTIFAASYGLAILSFFVSRSTAVSEERSRLLLQARRLNLQALGPELLRNIDTKGDAVRRSDFIVGMLTVLEIVKPEDLQPILRRFDSLDVNGDGELSRKEVESLLEQSAREAQSRPRDGHADSHGPEV